MNIQKKQYASDVPVFRHDGALRALPGGFVLDVSAWPDGAEIPAGTVIAVDEAARTALPVRTAVLSAPAAAGALQISVEKGHCIRAGDRLNGKAVSSVDASGPLEDVVELAAPLGGAMPAGTKLGTGDGSALTLHAVRAARGNAHPVDAIVGGTVYERRIGHVSDQTKKNLPNIVFSQSK